jgi:hypothetical protein
MAAPADRTPDEQAQHGWDRDVDALTLEQTWAVMMMAWRDRRRNPSSWRLIANHIHFVDCRQQGGA